MGLKKILKKVVKKAAKPAALIGAAYLASKGLGKKYNTSSVSSDNARGSNLRNILKSAMPGNLSKSAGPYKDSVGEGMNRGNWKNFHDDSAGQNLKSGGRATYKSGGAALRGVSPILMKGKK